VTNLGRKYSVRQENLILRTPSIMLGLKGRSMNAFVGRFLCFFGRHEWKFYVWPLMSGMAVGDKCVRCGLWSPIMSIRKSFESNTPDHAQAACRVEPVVGQEVNHGQD
jgi:hypothetical protein